MPNIQSAKKRVRVIRAKTAQNKSIRSSLKTDLKKFDAAVAGNSETAQELYIKAASAVDKAAAKGTIHKNKANRTKSQLAKKLSSPSA